MKKRTFLSILCLPNELGAAAAFVAYILGVPSWGLAQAEHDMDFRGSNVIKEPIDISSISFEQGHFLVAIHTPGALSTVTVDPKSWQASASTAQQLPTDLSLPGSILGPMLGATHPTKWGNSVITIGGTVVYLAKEGQVRQKIYTRDSTCNSNHSLGTAPVWMYSFFLDAQHIAIFDCGRWSVIDPHGRELYRVKDLFPMGTITTSSNTVSALRPVNSLGSALFLAPEDSVELQVFCLTNGKTLLRTRWKDAEWNVLASSADGSLVAMAKGLRARFFRLDVQKCAPQASRPE
jgi:hypothetical protein